MSSLKGVCLSDGMHLWQNFFKNIQNIKQKTLPTINKRGKEIMTDDNKWSEDEFDLQLYNSMDAEGKRAWRAVFGLPDLLKKGNPSAAIEQNAEGDD